MYGERGADANEQWKKNLASLPASEWSLKYDEFRVMAGEDGAVVEDGPGHVIHSHLGYINPEM